LHKVQIKKALGVIPELKGFGSTRTHNPFLNYVSENYIMENTKRKIFDKINKLRNVSIAAIKKLSATVELILIDTDIIAVDKYTRQDIREKLKSIENCSTLVELREYENGETTLHNANFCKNPIVCPICASRVSNKRRALYLPAVERAVDRYAVDDAIGIEKGYPIGYTGVYLCTATIRAGENLEERINFLTESILRFRKMGQRREKGFSGGEWNKIKCALSNVEIKIGTGSHQWHVHAHFLVFTNEPLNTKLYDSTYTIEIDDKENPGQKKIHTLSKIQYEWYLATNCEAFIFDVKNISYRENVGKVKCDSFSQSIMLQSAEVFKYNTKLTEEGNLEGLSGAQYIELIQRRGGRRLFNAIGEFRCDKRNERSLMTITEKEIRKQEYIDKYDSFTYNIYSSEYRKDLFGYSDLQKEDQGVFKNSDELLSKFKDLRKYAFSSMHSRMTAEYRKSRGIEIKTIRSIEHAKLKRTGVYNYDEIRENFEMYIDGLKDCYRRNVREFWHDFNNENVEVHIYPEEKKYIILKTSSSHIMSEKKKENIENFKDYLDELRKEYKNIDYFEKKIVASNMTTEEIELHKNASPEQYTIV
jgi:hypothetical protein